MAGRRTNEFLAIGVGAACLAWLAAGCASVAVEPTRRANNLNDYAMTDAGNDLAMMLDLPGFTIDRSKAAATPTFVFASDERNALFFSASLGRGVPAGDCRDVLWQRARTNPDFDTILVAKRSVGEFGVFDYDMRGKAGTALAATPAQRHLVGCRTAGDHLAYVHVSRLGFVPEDEKLLNSVLADVYLRQAVESPASGARVFDMPQGRRLLLDVPHAWWAAVWQPPGELPPTIKLLSRSEDAAKFELTAFWNLPDAPSNGSRDDLRAQAERAAEAAVAKTGIATPELSGWDDGERFGFYYTVTYGDSGAYAYPHMTQGFARADDLLVQFTISTNAADDPMIARGLEAMRTARQERL